MNDNEMIRLLFERNETVIAEIENRYKKQCMRVARNILRNEQDAEECFNDALLKLWNTVPPKEPRSLFAYLSVITEILHWTDINTFRQINARKPILYSRNWKIAFRLRIHLRLTSLQRSLMNFLAKRKRKTVKFFFCGIMKRPQCRIFQKCFCFLKQV